MEVLHIKYGFTKDCDGNGQRWCVGIKERTGNYPRYPS